MPDRRFEGVGSAESTRPRGAFLSVRRQPRTVTTADRRPAPTAGIGVDDVAARMPRPRPRLSPWLALVAFDAGAGLAVWTGVLAASSLRIPMADGVAVTGAATVASLGSLAARQLYREHVRRVLAVELSGVTRAAFLATVAAAVAASLTGTALGLGITVVAFAVHTLALMLVRGAARTVVRAARRAGRFQQRVLLVGESSATAHLADELGRRPSEGYLVVGAVGDERAHQLRGVACPYLGPVDDMERVLVETGATGAIVATDGLGRKDATEVVRRLVEGGVTVQLAGTLGLHHRRLRATAIGQETAFYVERVSLTGPQRTVKRAIDITGACLGLVLASPLLMVAAVAIRLHDGGPVLFRQQRIGRHGEVFVMVKLRTMRPDAERLRAALEPENRREGPLFKHAADPRVTRPGRWLRATSIDEIPQLWNVLCGQMSLVGPRPALPAEVALFGENLLRRHAVRPGITGMWQVEARDSARFEDLERHDLFYVENWSVLLDLGLLARTLGGVLVRAWRISRREAGSFP